MDFFRQRLDAVLGTLTPPFLTRLWPSIAAFTVNCIYNVWFHPLSVFPGPKSWAVTSLSPSWQNWVTGTFQRRLQVIMAKHGPIVRTGPDTLYLDGEVGWPQVFGHQSGKPEYQKPPGWFGADIDKSILMAPHETHRRQRRHLAHAFSEAALVEQQAYVLKYVNIIMDKFSQRAKDGKEVNVVDWFNFLTFDIIGELAFGDDSFGSLVRDGYHPWVRDIVDSFYDSSLLHLSYLQPLLTPVVLYRAGPGFFKRVASTQETARIKAQARIDEGEVPGRRDFMTYVTRKNRVGELGLTPEEQLTVAPVLVGAATETTASVLSGLLFFLGNNLVAAGHLQHEIRTAFASEQDVDMKTTGRLPYLVACIEEALRLYPSTVETIPRVSPGAELQGQFVPKGTLVFVSQYVTYRNPRHFVDADAFRPERWLPATHTLYNDKYANDKCSLVKPFSYGPRDCLGKNLAYAEIRIVLSRITLRFDWELLQGQDNWIENQVMSGVWMKKPLKVKFKHRQEGVTI